MLKACPRCQELVLDTSGECRRCQKRFAPDRLPPLTPFELKRLLMERQKELATLIESGAGKRRWGWLRYPLRLIGWSLGAVAVFLLLHLLVMDYGRQMPMTAGVAAVTLLTGYLSAASLQKAHQASPFSQGRLGEVEKAIRLLEEAIAR